MGTVVVQDTLKPVIALKFGNAVVHQGSASDKGVNGETNPAKGYFMADQSNNFSIWACSRGLRTEKQQGSQPWSAGLSRHFFKLYRTKNQSQPKSRLSGILIFFLKKKIDAPFVNARSV